MASLDLKASDGLVVFDLPAKASNDTHKRDRNADYPVSRVVRNYLHDAIANGHCHGESYVQAPGKQQFTKL